jgi:hypothetical protein
MILAIFYGFSIKNRNLKGEFKNFNFKSSILLGAVGKTFKKFMVSCHLSRKYLQTT